MAGEAIRSTASPESRAAAKSFKPFDGVAIGAPRVGGRESLRGLAPVHGAAISQVSGSKPLKPKSCGEGADQRLVAAFAQAARHAGERDEQIGFEAAFGRCAEDVQAVADLRFLEVAEIGIEALQVLVVIAGEARIEVEAGGSREVENVARSESRRRRSRPEAR